MKRLCYVLLALVANCAAAWGQGFDPDDGGPSYPINRESVPSWRRTDGPHVRAAFREVVAGARDATVRVRSDGVNCALGGVVGPDGWILTKASQLDGAITCQLADGREFDARVVGESRDFDVAMLKIEAKRLPTLKIDENLSPRVGSWLATAGMGRTPVSVGIVSVGAREIPHEAGILGIQMAADSQRPKIEMVFPHTGAAQAGMLEGDVVLTIDGKPTGTREELVELVQTYNPGDRLVLEVERDSQILKLEANLTSSIPGMRPDREEFQNHLGTDLSQRRFGFPTVFQHDTVVKPVDCGGPVVNLDGQVVGFNIARAGRTETYAIGTPALAKLMYEMMSGSMKPEAEPIPALAE